MYISPCVQICRIDAFTHTCIGCGRTIKEISDWSGMTYYERNKIMKRLGYGKRTSTQDRMAREAARNSARNDRDD